jgi:hypothetical protein
VAVEMLECRICNIWFPKDGKSCPMCELKIHYLNAHNRSWKLMQRIEKLMDEKVKRLEEATS